MIQRNARLILLPGRPDRGVLQAGEAYFVYHDTGDIVPCGLIHGCPCGCEGSGALFFQGEGRGRPEWAVTGVWPDVSLTPSIGLHRGKHLDLRADGFHWHGYLKFGVFEELP